MYYNSGGVRVGSRVRFQAAKVSIFGGFQVENPTNKATGLKALLTGISLSEYGSEGGVWLTRLSEYGSVACLVERPTRETQAEQHSDTVLIQFQGWPRHNHNHNLPKTFCIGCHTKTAFDGTSDEKSLLFVFVPLCRRGIWCVIRGYPKHEKWGPRDELKNGRGRGWAVTYNFGAPRGGCGFFSKGSSCGFLGFRGSSKYWNLQC